MSFIPSFDLTTNGFQLINPEGTNIYNLDTFKVHTNTSKREVVKFEELVNSYSEGITLENIGFLDSNELDKTLINSNKIKLNLDKYNINTYAYFSSLRTKLGYTVKDIIRKFPGAIEVNKNVNGLIKNTVLFHNYNSITDTTSFSAPVSTFRNPYLLDYTQSTESGTTENKSSLKFIVKNKEKYSIYVDNIEYGIISLTGSPSLNNGYLNIVCEGNPFTNVVNNTSSVNYHIKPKFIYFQEFLSNLTELESFLLNKQSDPLFTCKFTIPRESDSGIKYLETKSLTWTRTDGYNLDNENQNSFTKYLVELLDIGQYYDDFKTNILYRKLIAKSLFEYDETLNANFHAIMDAYSYQFDTLKIFIDGLTHVNRVTYDKSENLSDILIKNFAKTLGWGVTNSLSEKNLLESFIGVQNVNPTSDVIGEYSPVEIDTELWRRIVINTSWLWKSKGTRKAINFLFKLIGAPDCLININENVYIVDNKLSSTQIEDLKENTLNEFFLYTDDEGYPLIQNNRPDYYFQNDGGWYEEITILSPIKEPQGIHKGNYDNGEKYFNVFRDSGFKLNRVVDNKKSWVNANKINDRNDINTNTSYTKNDEDLILNNKEINLSIDAATAIECDVYNCNANYNLPISNTGVTGGFYPQNTLTKFNASGVSFIKYIDNLLTYFIDAKNRKVIDDAHGGGYPTLKQLYEYYLTLNFCNSYDYKDMINYLELLDGYWMDLLAQVIPSTTIFLGNSEVWRNTIFHPQKFVYKRGINDGSEFSNTVKVDDDLRIKLKYLSITGNVNTILTGKTNTFKSSISDIEFSYPCIDVNLDTSFIHRRLISNDELTVFFGNWDSTLTNTYGPLCKACEDGYFVECGYLENGYYGCDCPNEPSRCTTIYVDCDYVEDVYVD